MVYRVFFIHENANFGPYVQAKFLGALAAIPVDLVESECKGRRGVSRGGLGDLAEGAAKAAEEIAHPAGEPAKQRPPLFDYFVGGEIALFHPRKLDRRFRLRGVRAPQRMNKSQIVANDPVDLAFEGCSHGHIV